MHVALIYGSLDTLSGGYLYDRKLVEHLRARGDVVDVISLPWRNYGRHLLDNAWVICGDGWRTVVDLILRATQPPVALRARRI